MNNKTLLVSGFIVTVVFVAIVTTYIVSSQNKVITINQEESDTFLKPPKNYKEREAFFAAVIAAVQRKRDRNRGGGSSGGTTSTSTATSTTGTGTTPPPAATTTATSSTSTPPAGSTSAFVTDSFSATVSIQEADSPLNSSDDRWWVNSGAYFNQNGGTGKTVLGNLASTDRWNSIYKSSNPIDTDGGIHPQNIFRLVEQDIWTNFTQQFYFKINKQNVSASPNRNASNGVLLFNRYQSGDNLYYVGIRVDGAVVIKKKYKGSYYTLAYEKILPGTYDINTNPNLLPVGSWYGIKSEVFNNADGSVTIRMYTDPNKTGVWTKVLETKDVPGTNGDAVISGGGFAGIRTDFEDVEFDDYNVTAK